MRKPNGYWTKEKCKEEALKYTKRNDFNKKSHNAYEIARRNNWLNDICHHMINKVYKQKGYWTKERCHEEALKYNTRTTFENNSHSAYRISLRCGWLDDVCSHMELQHKPNNYWTKERCHEEALKYNTRTEFHKKSTGDVYGSAIRNLWLDDICYHMVKKGNYKKRCIYVYEFNDNSAYVGLTYYIENRHNRHLNDKNSQVYKHINKTKNYKLIKLTNYINVNDAIKLEKEYVDLYKNNGWNILNIAKTGSIGGNILKWTYDKCKEEALKYNTRSEFTKYNNGAYKSAYSNDWLDDICLHIKLKIIKWTKEDELFLLENYKNKGVNFCMKKLNRSKNAIRSRYYLKNNGN